MEKEIIEHQYCYVEADVIKPSETSDFEMYINHMDYDNFQFYANAQTD